MKVQTETRELVSVIVPVYNEERYLEACIKSIQDSKYGEIEIILVDDGSTNHASVICDQLAGTDERIQVIHKKNGGLSAARLDGIRASRGTWIMFVDNDDLLSPYAIEDFSKFFANKQVDIIAGGRIDLEDPSPYEWKDKADDYVIEEGRQVCSKICIDQQKTIITPMWGKVYRKTFLDKIQLEKYRDICPTIFLEDVLMTPILYCAARQICIIDNVFYIHREVTDSISRSMKLCSFFYEQIDSGNILLEFFKENSMDNMYDYQLDIFYRTILRLYCLIDYENIPDEYKNCIREKVVIYYKKYYTDYAHAKGISLKHKMLFLLFQYNNHVWKKLVNLLYYRRL